MDILLTGGTGYLGEIIRSTMQNYHRVYTLSNSLAADYTCNLAKQVPHFDQSFERVIHVAGKAHSVPKTNQETQEFWDVNVIGTQNLLTGLETAGVLPKQIVFISTVAVYGREEGINIDEKHNLAGKSAYARSKIEAENLLSEWGSRYGVAILILRLPLVSGINPPGNLGSMIQAMKMGYYFRIGKGNNHKSMVGAPDVAKLISRKSDSHGIFNLTDGIHPSVSDIDLHIAGLIHKKVRELPVWIIKLTASLGDILPGFPINSKKFEKLTSSLTFSDDKARRELDWNPRPAIESLSIKASSTSLKLVNFHMIRVLRAFDILLAMIGLVFFSPFLILLLLIGLLDSGSPLFIQKRMGKNQKPFWLIKLRTMRKDTKSVGTHLVNSNAVTKYGSLLRRTKLDEVPQLWNVLLGQMSLVGPRPNLMNQMELIEERAKRGVYTVRPGVTGLAQINKIDMSTPEHLANIDAKMISSLNIKYYFLYIMLTMIGKGRGDNIKTVF